MSDVKKGDMAMVIRARPCCGATPRMGFTFIVQSVIERQGRCKFCKVSGAVRVATFAGAKGIILSRLLRIDPPAQGETRGASVRKRKPVLVRA
jgi:hypothetical protein